MAKGKRVRKEKSPFKEGHQNSFKRTKSDSSTELQTSSSERKIIRLTPVMHSNVVQTPVGPGVSANQTDSAMLLRPKPKLQVNDGSDEHYRLLAPTKLLELINKAIDGHKPFSCDGQLLWDKDVEVKWGLCWRMGLRCCKCSYRTGRVKLYYEVPTEGPGQRPATANVALQIGLTQSMISNTSIRQILMSTNIPPPAHSGMQDMANFVGESIVDLNTDDMAKQRGTIKEVLQLRGEGSSSIPVEADGRYNNPLWSGGGKTPFQPSTQTAYTVCENVTKAKKIIGVYTGNKLCQKGERLRKYDKNIKCPNHHGVCTANLAPTDSIGDEQRALRHVIRDIQPDLEIGAVTADGDSHATKAVSPQTLILRDTRHMGQSLKRQIEKTPFSDIVFPGKNKADRESLKKRFASDLTKRCNGEFHKCFNKNKGNISQIKRDLSYVMDSIIKCYSGDCALCKKYSFICDGKSEKYLLPPNTKLNFTNITDENMLRECLKHRLGSKAIDLTRLNSNTQKCESVNRTYQKTNPKQVTWSRNFPGRIHSAIHLRNNGFATSTSSKLLALGINPSDSILPHLKAEEKSMKARIINSKSYKSKLNKIAKIKEKYRLYDKNKSCRKIHYSTGVSLPRVKVNKPPKKHCDHSYAK